MTRTRRLLRGGSWLGGVVALSFVLLATPVDLAPAPETEAYRQSLASLEATLAARATPPSPSQLLAGVAKREIAPPLTWEVPLAGNRRLRFARAEGRRPESVWARALALRQGERHALLVSADIMVISPLLAERVLERVRRVVSLEAGELLLVAAHTHSGPGGYWEGFLAELSVGPYDERVLEFLVDRLAAAALDAWRRLVPVEVAFGTVDMAIPIKHRTRKLGPENPELLRLSFEALDGSFAAEVVNFSAHPTNLLKGNRLLTGDYPALMAAMVDDRHRTMIFTPGTIGDMKPSYVGIRDPDLKARSIAEHLVHRGLGTLESWPLRAPVLEAFEVAIAMPPLQPRLFRSDLLGSWALRSWLASLVFPDDFGDTVVQVLRVGSVAVIGAPSDLASSIGRPLIERARRHGLEVLFVSMADDWIGYVLQEDEYVNVAYKETSQFHGPQTGPLFAAVYGRLIDWLGERVRSEPGPSGVVSQQSISTSESVPR